MSDLPARVTATFTSGQALLTAGLAALALLIYWTDPEGVDWLPKCPLHQLTGLHCPGCGSTRAAHALLHGDVPRALAMNALVTCATAPAAIYCVWKRRRLGPGWSSRISRRAILVCLCVLLGFALLRNLPAHPFSLLAPH